LPRLDVRASGDVKLFRYSQRGQSQVSETLFFDQKLVN